MTKESAYELQKIDCNCNDCISMVRDNDRLVSHKQTFEGLGFIDDLQFGKCLRFKKNVSFIPNTCQIETQKCFSHRKDRKARRTMRRKLLDTIEKLVRRISWPKAVIKWFTRPEMQVENRESCRAFVTLPTNPTYNQ